ncbi:SET domain family protein [Candida albicans]|uniref:Histone-lysine N-methyltransferase SET5 n=1 Tax=Candida albicans TaxID=5476 RepID=A0A8H6F2I4_CANAX|nr:SET domain family protein [Candida albicans]
MTQDISEKIEVISINDSQPEDSSPVVPHERQVVDCVIEIWKEDPSTESLGMSKLHALVKQKHPNWSISEKRVKFTYAKEITSVMTPDIELPANVHIIMTSKRGKGLYAKRDIAKGDLIWSEEPLFFIPPLANVNLMKTASACTYCGKLLQRTESATVLKGLDCNVCSEVWCSIKCKHLDGNLHSLLKHNLYNPGSKKHKLIDAEAFLELQDYCLEEQWNALYAITLIYANCITDKSGINSSAGTFDSLNGGALFVQEQQEHLWKIGYEKFLRVFPKKPVEYREFLFMMGTYNINNLDSNVFLTQSHLNHNCASNTSVETELNRTAGLKVIAGRDIKSGEELTTTYVNPSHTVHQRQRELRVNWGFICACAKCKDDLKQNERRKSSHNQQQNANNIRDMLKETKDAVGEEGIELEIPTEFNGERRKSVRFDEKVVAVKE